ncbi:Protein ANTAGONIST OF LIKE HETEROCHROMATIN PROTEIN 1 [Frankliniella fusca]|uniref:Protein ANTAGONIST OF LIKE HETEROCHROMATIN PROTEIN 1 n=1 Tax=Frankliniella fusca TaxID=407009 RepID=A0AAE1HSL6_9NEOP|nr:Protein ANTAGONIST OF LIKE HETEROCHROMATIN PROTEIN 1 [Frankliniella fusca]
MYGYPGVVGCIDGCHIVVTAPFKQPQRYVDRKFNYSILLQAVCDHNVLFRDVYVGQPGSEPLGSRHFRNPNVVLDNHLLGDGGYTLTDKIYPDPFNSIHSIVIISYTDNGNLTRRQRVLNREGIWAPKRQIEAFKVVPQVLSGVSD